MNRFRLSRDKKAESGATTPRHSETPSPERESERGRGRGREREMKAQRSPTKEQYGDGDVERDGAAADGDHIRLLRPYTFALASIVSIGGFIFGYDTGQISG
jgi:SP family sugar:H+ symporter-like MFS transporter